MNWSPSRPTLAATPAPLVGELASLLAAGLLRLPLHPANVADSDAAGLEVSPPAPLSGGTTGVNAVELSYRSIRR